MKSHRQTIETAPLIYDYKSYRDFLRDYYSYKKFASPAFSYRVFSRLAGFSSPNILKLVIDGQRNITFKALPQYAKALDLDQDQVNFLKLLVSLERAKTADEIETIQQELERHRPKERKTLNGSEEAEYLSHWLYPVIDELTKHHDFEFNAEWIQSKLNSPPSLTEINASLTFLKEFGFIELGKNGRYTSSTRLLASTDGEKKLQIRRYHRRVLKQGIDMLDLLDIDERMYRAITLSIPSESFADLKNILFRFKEDLLHWYLEQDSRKNQRPEKTEDKPSSNSTSSYISKRNKPSTS